MTMIIAANLKDCILIAADKRSMVCDLETGALRFHSDQEQKIKLWRLGAVVGTGETIFLDRVAQYFMNYQQGNLYQIDAIHEELEKRVFEGVPISCLNHNIIIYSLFNGVRTTLYSISIEPFFHILQGNGTGLVRPGIKKIEANNVIVNCFNIPLDMTSLQNFQRNIKSRSNFINDREFVAYYIQHLKEIFATHASIDPTITASFDLYMQTYKTGESFAIHISNHALVSTIPEDLNYWEVKRENELRK